MRTVRVSVQDFRRALKLHLQPATIITRRGSDLLAIVLPLDLLVLQLLEDSGQLDALRQQAAKRH